MKMIKTVSGAQSWFPVKYGKDVQPYSCSVKIKTDVSLLSELPQIVEYYYTRVDTTKGTNAKERCGLRKFELMKTDTYTGIIQNDGKKWIINGVVNIDDGNFLGSRFTYKKIDDMGVFIGSYPNSQGDIDDLNAAGVNQILCLLTDEETRKLGIKRSELASFCTKRGIRTIRMPLNDIVIEDYCNDLFRIAQVVNQTVDQQKQKIFIHCSSGVSRSATLALAYMRIFKRVEHWTSGDSCLNYLKSFHP